MEFRKGKEFVFPDNTSSDYGIFRGITLGYFIRNILPILFLIVLFIAFFPPINNWIAYIIKFGISAVVLTVYLAVILTPPVPERNNITYHHYRRFRKLYKNRQKLFYMKKKKNRKE